MNDNLKIQKEIDTMIEAEMKSIEDTIFENFMADLNKFIFSDNMNECFKNYKYEQKRKHLKILEEEK